jgi:hypothetical protein
MGKALIILVVAVAAGLFLYNYMKHADSEEAALVDGIRARYVGAVNKFLKAGSMAGGLDTNLDAESAANEILGIRAELAALQKSLTETKAIRKADKLADKIERFCRQHSII